MHLLLLVAAAVVLTACGPTPSSVQRVTPLPTNDASQPIVIAPTATASALPPTEPEVTTVVPVVTPSPVATATPLDFNLEAGQARSIAEATDAFLQPTPRNLIRFDVEPVAIKFDEFYDGYDMRTGLKLSDKLVSLDGHSAEIEGYMAPPLKPELDYFVLTRVKLAFCPFCTTGADWPDDIALIYLPEGQTTIATDRPVRIVGRMEVGQSVDQETGMVSLVRIYAERLEPIG